MTSIVNSPEKSTVTATSVIEKLKSLSSGVAHKATEGAQEISSGISKETANISTLVDTPSSTISTIIRYIFIILLVCFILLNIFAVLGLLPPNLAEFFSPVLLFLGHSPYKVSEAKVQQPVTATAKSDKTIISDKSPSLDIMEDVIDKPVQELKDSSPRADDASSDIQAKSKSGYCYVGKQDGYRSCVKVDEHMTCMSGDIFPTKDVCINPKLRP